jgi:hypothetical protein
VKVQAPNSVRVLTATMVNYHTPLQNAEPQGFKPEPTGLDNRLNIKIQVRDGRVRNFQLSVDKSTPDPESCVVFRSAKPPPLLDPTVEATLTKLWDSTYPDKPHLHSGCKMWEIPIPPNASYSLASDVLTSLAAAVPPAIRLFISSPTPRKDTTATATTPRVAILPRAGTKSMTSYDQRVLVDYWFCVLHWANMALARRETPPQRLDEFAETYFKKVVQRGVHSGVAVDFEVYCGSFESC